MNHKDFVKWLKKIGACNGAVNWVKKNGHTLESGWKDPECLGCWKAWLCGLATESMTDIELEKFGWPTLEQIISTIKKEIPRNRQLRDYTLNKARTLKRTGKFTSLATGKEYDCKFGDIADCLDVAAISVAYKVKLDLPHGKLWQIKKEKWGER